LLFCVFCNDLYRTKNGRCASPYSIFDYGRHPDTAGTVKPTKIDFEQEVFYSIAGWKKQRIKERFPEPYYRIEGNKAIAVYGNYIPELFELKKTGVFTARGLYGKHDSTDEIVPEPVELELVEEVKITKKEAKELANAWNELYTGILNQQTQKIRSIALDSVVCSVCEGFAEPYFYNDEEPIDSFIVTAYRNLPGTEIWEHMKAGKYKLSAKRYPETKPSHIPVSSNEQLIIYEVTFSILVKYEEYKREHYHSFEFVKVNGKFKFSGMRSD
jgi:hypothetical protein